MLRVLSSLPRACRKDVERQRRRVQLAWLSAAAFSTSLLAVMHRDLALPGVAFTGQSLPQMSATTSLYQSRGATAVPVDPMPRTRKARSQPRTEEEARELLQEVLEVARGAGIRAGVVRSIQGLQAAVETAVDLARSGDGAALLDALSGRRQIDEALVARTLRAVFERLGATYIKLGQFIASSPTLFPAVYVKEFQKCLDRTETVPFSVVQEIVEADLGRPLFAAFRKFERKPLASASVAQVHAATLPSGEDVVVKVLKPGVAETMQADLGFLYIAVRVIEFLNPELSRSSLGDIIAEIRSSMLNELDLNLERQNLETFRSFLVQSGLQGVAAAPKPYAEVSTKRVLTMERFRGVPLIDLDGIRAYTVNPEQTLISALNVWALSVRNCELFHADVHAGNLFVLEDGRVGFIDFGIVGSVPPKIWEAIENFSVAFVSDDTRGMARALISMGATGKSIDEVKFGNDIRDVLTRLRDIQADVVVQSRTDGTVSAQVALDDSQSTDFILEVVRVADDNDLKLPREFALLLKQALYFDRYTKLLAPDLDPLSDDRVTLGLAGRS